MGRDAINPNSRNRPPALYRLMTETLLGKKKKPRMGFSIFEKGPTGPLYGDLLSADTGQVIYLFGIFGGSGIRGS